MTPSRTIRQLFLATMFASIAGVLAWAGWIGWREWPRWRAVREMRAAVEANEPGRFLDAVERVDSLGVAAAAADEIAPLRRHPDPRVRMYAVMARTVLGPRGHDEAKELIDLFDDANEDIEVRCAAATCLILFRDQAHVAIRSFREAMLDTNDPRYSSASGALSRLGEKVPWPEWPEWPEWRMRSRKISAPRPNATRREQAEFLIYDIGLGLELT